MLGLAGHFLAGAFYGLGTLEDEAGSEVLGADVFIGGKLLRSAFLEDDALVKQVGAVCDGKGLTNVVVRDDDTYVAVLEFGDDLLDVLNGDGVNAGKRLVQEDELGVYGKGAGYLAATALTAGKLYAQGFTDL